MKPQARAWKFAQGAIAAARCAATRPAATALTWQDLLDWPAWALDDAPARDALALRAAALWHAGALRHCIDGRLLQQVGRWIGEPALQHLMTAPDEAPHGPGALPAPEQLEAVWREAGRALLLASIASPALRAAVAAHVQGSESWPRAEGIDAGRAQQILARALDAPPQEALA
jgi:hypothetical protein